MRKFYEWILINVLLIYALLGVINMALYNETLFYLGFIVLVTFWVYQFYVGINLIIKGKKFMIVTICGSSKFRDLMLKVGKDLTLKNKIVLLPLVFSHCGDVITEEEKFNLDKLHFDKIMMSKEIHIVSFNNYIGDSTKNEIEYAKKLNKSIIYHNFEDVREDSSRESNIVEV